MERLQVEGHAMLATLRRLLEDSSAAELDYQREIHELRLQLELLSRDADLRLNHALNQQCTALERYYESILAAHEQAAQEEKATACARLQARLEAELQAQLQASEAQALHLQQLLQQQHNQAQASAQQVRELQQQLQGAAARQQELEQHVQEARRAQHAEREANIRLTEQLRAASAGPATAQHATNVLSTPDHTGNDATVGQAGKGAAKRSPVGLSELYRKKYWRYKQNWYVLYQKCLGCPNCVALGVPEPELYGPPKGCMAGASQAEPHMGGGGAAAAGSADDMTDGDECEGGAHVGKQQQGRPRTHGQAQASVHGQGQGRTLEAHKLASAVGQVQPAVEHVEQQPAKKARVTWEKNGCAAQVAGGAVVDQTADSCCAAAAGAATGLVGAAAKAPAAGAQLPQAHVSAAQPGASSLVQRPSAAGATAQPPAALPATNDSAKAPPVDQPPPLQPQPEGQAQAQKPVQAQAGAQQLVQQEPAVPYVNMIPETVMPCFGMYDEEDEAEGEGDYLEMHELPIQAAAAPLGHGIVDQAARPADQANAAPWANARHVAAAAQQATEAAPAQLWGQQQGRHPEPNLQPPHAQQRDQATHWQRDQAARPQAKSGNVVQTRATSAETTDAHPPSGLGPAPVAQADHRPVGAAGRPGALRQLSYELQLMRAAGLDSQSPTQVCGEVGDVQGPGRAGAGQLQRGGSGGQVHQQVQQPRQQQAPRDQQQKQQLPMQHDPKPQERKQQRKPPQQEQQQGSKQGRAAAPRQPVEVVEIDTSPETLQRTVSHTTSNTRGVPAAASGRGASAAAAPSNAQAAQPSGGAQQTSARGSGGEESGQESESEDLTQPSPNTLALRKAALERDRRKAGAAGTGQTKLAAPAVGQATKGSKPAAAAGAHEPVLGRDPVAGCGNGQQEVSSRPSQPSSKPAGGGASKPDAGRAQGGAAGGKWHTAQREGAMFGYLNKMGVVGKGGRQQQPQQQGQQQGQAQQQKKPLPPVPSDFSPLAASKQPPGAAPADMPPPKQQAPPAAGPQPRCNTLTNQQPPRSSAAPAPVTDTSAVQGGGLDAAAPAQQQQAAQRAEGQQPGQAGYKYNEVVRKKDARAELPGYACYECQRFFEAMASWGRPTGAMPVCGHQAPAAAAAAAAGAQARDEYVQETSRHRARYQPPSTPKDFWNLGFPNSPA